MRRTGVIVVVILAQFITCAWSQDSAGPDSLPPAASAEEKKILNVIEEMLRERKTYLSVPVSDGRMLRLLTEARRSQTVVEIGTSTGFSGLWICLALQRTGGRLITFEIDPGRAASARRHFEQAGVAHLVTVLEGDAHERIKELKDPIDLVFIDADKEGYTDYLNQLLPLVRSGGLILAHNVKMRAVQEGYLQQVRSNPSLETVLYMEGGGMGITLKK